MGKHEEHICRFNNWGKCGIVTDENCNAFQDLLKEIKEIK